MKGFKKKLLKNFNFFLKQTMVVQKKNLEIQPMKKHLAMLLFMRMYKTVVISELN